MKEPHIFDSTPLIYLGKVGILSKIKEISSQNSIPHSVFQEVVVIGKDKNEPEAFHIEELIQKGIFQICKVKEKMESLPKNLHISLADRDVVTLAMQLKGRAITDDEMVRSIAKMKGIKVGGTVYILLKLVESQVISKSQCKEVLDKIIHQGWYCSAQLYSDILQKL